MLLWYDIVSGNDRTPSGMSGGVFVVLYCLVENFFLSFVKNIFEKIACFVDIFITLFANRHIVR